MYKYIHIAWVKLPPQHHSSILISHHMAWIRLHQDYMCDPLRVRPVLCTVPTRGWSLLQQVGGVWGWEGLCEAKPRGLQSIHISQFPVLCHQVLRSRFGLCHELDTCTNKHTLTHTHIQTYNRSPHWINLFSFALCQQYSGLCCRKKDLLTKGPHSCSWDFIFQISSLLLLLPFLYF